MASPEGIVVLHRYWNAPGGSQMVCASAAHSFRSLGLKPVLASMASLKLENYVTWYGIDLSGLEVVRPKFFPRPSGLLSRPFVWIPAKAALKKTRAHLLFSDESTYKPLLNSFPDLKVIEYVHFPIEALIKPEYRELGFYYKDDPSISERYNRFPMNAYWWAYTRLVNHYNRDDPFRSAKAVIANSKWTAGVVKKIFGKEPIVINPPLPPSVQTLEKIPPFEDRKNAVLMVGRFNPRKNYEWAVEKIGKPLQRLGAKLLIIGSSTTESQRQYSEAVANRAKAEGLKVAIKENSQYDGESAFGENADIVLLPNTPRSVINSIADKSKVFLHSTENEHWGIAIAEAMARGLPVVLHESGGAWHELADDGQSAIGYKTPAEALTSIEKLLTDAALWQLMSTKSVERAKALTLKEFQKSLDQILKTI
ncbi:MAG: glycosyltransferase [Thermoprotei archaeon]